MFHTLLFAFAVALFGGCGGSGDEPQPATVSITVSQDNIAVPATGGTYSISVTTTGKEWGAYADKDFITLDAKNTTSQSGSLTIIVAANPLTEARTASVTIMSGSARKTIAVTQEAAEESPYYSPEGYSLVWHDEFDKGSELNADDWVHEVQNSGWVNHELQNYVNHKTPDGRLVTEVRDGKLRITALKENGKIYSGRVYAKRNTGWKYGYIEASIKLPKGKGTWPAFWMMPVHFTAWPDDGEIDIMEEVGYHPNYTSSSIHCKKYYHSIGTQKTKERYCAGAEGEFHKYALEWTTDYIRTYVDDKELFYFENDGKGDKQTWPFNKPFYIILNLAWGGDWGGAQGVDESALPVTMEVDYVRVFQKP